MVVFNPIWKDLSVTLVAQASTKFRITYDSQVIYTGIAYPKPGANAPKVRINDICADYLTRHFPLESADTYDATFLIEEYDNTLQSWEEVGSVKFCRDWSYDYGYTPSTDQAPVAPIVPYVLAGQYLPLFGYGGVWGAVLHFITGGDFNNDYNRDFYLEGENVVPVGDDDGDGDFEFLDLSEYSGLGKVVANGLAYEVRPCGTAALYYINAYGGWDSLPILGRVKRSASLSRHTTDREYNNAVQQARGRDNYVNEVAEKFTFCAGPFTSDQASRMHHLLDSTMVYFHDLATNLIWPVVLTATAREVKDLRGTIHFYDIEATLAQERVRR